jgi:FKBP-type peptidyl-prolyl cis-trans isomerase FkpA
MKRFFVTFVLAGLVAAGVACAADPELKTDDDKTFYALGLVISNQLSTFRLTPAELELVKAGLTDGTLKKPAKIELDAFGPKIKPLAESRQAAAAVEEKKKGKEYLDKLAANPKIKKTASGLLYETTAEGTGKSPAPTDKVKVNYKGTLTDGTVFDSTEKHGGTPATFQLDQVIKCWTEGVQLMKTGGKAKLYCPADLAYGDRGQAAIPPGATLVFEVELLEIVADAKK